jgi:hypothetical protein
MMSIPGFLTLTPVKTRTISDRLDPGLPDFRETFLNAFSASSKLNPCVIKSLSWMRLVYNNEMASL